MSNKPKTVSELYPRRWLKAEDLRGKPVDVIVESAYVDEVYNQRERCNEWKAILDFGRSKDLILNKTQTMQMQAITGIEFFAEWAGVQVRLTPSIARNGKPTINISSPPAPPPLPDVESASQVGNDDEPGEDDFLEA